MTQASTILRRIVEQSRRHPRISAVSALAVLIAALASTGGSGPMVINPAALALVGGNPSSASHSWAVISGENIAPGAASPTGGGASVGSSDAAPSGDVYYDQSTDEYFTLDDNGDPVVVDPSTLPAGTNIVDSSNAPGSDQIANGTSSDGGSGDGTTATDHGTSESDVQTEAPVATPAPEESSAPTSDGGGS
jgi:hypothetical protein